MNIGKKISKHRKKMNISQKELANHIFVSRQTISNWENDKSLPEMDNLISLSKFFNIPLASLIEEGIEEFNKTEIEKKIINYNTLLLIFLIFILFFSILLVGIFGNKWLFLPFLIINGIFILLLIFGSHIKIGDSSYIKKISNYKIIAVTICSLIISFLLTIILLNVSN